MGAVCCRHQDEPLLSLPRVSAMSLHRNQLYVPASLAAASSASVSTGQSLANYVSFPFPFLSKPRTVITPTKRDKKDNKTIHDEQNCKSPNGQQSRAIAMPYVGPHWRQTTRGTFDPLPLFELSIRHLCTHLVVHHQAALETVILPPEVASKVLQYLRHHDILEKAHFHALVPFLLLEWNLANQQEVEDAWFDNVPVTTLEKVKSIDVSGCIHLQHLGSERSLVFKLPELMVAKFKGCSGLLRESIEMLQFSTKLTRLDLSGCNNVDDKTLKTISTLEYVKSLELIGCYKLSDVGIKYLLKMTKLEKLRLGRCRKLTDDVFDGFASSLVELRELDVANCRLRWVLFSFDFDMKVKTHEYVIMSSDKTMQHLGRIKSLELLVIRGCQEISNESMESLRGLTRLKYFDARHCNKVHSIPIEWTQLQVLLLGYTAFTESDAAVLQYLTGLQELELRTCRIMKRGFQLISRLKHLERLDVGETSLTDNELLEICNGNRNLKALNISDTEVSDYGTFGLAKLKELRILRLDTKLVTSRALANVSFLSRLEKLDLFGANITDNGLLHLVRLHKLQELSICGGNISDRGVGIISKLTSLTSLNLSQNRNIRTKSMFYLRSLTGLRCLNLSNTGISALSLRHLSPLKELQFLSVYGCPLSQGHIDILRGMRLFPLCARDEV
ncbi:hypothetical protein DD238_003422 [Peronospora effusa]|uniref:F-box/LRR-repeat protein 15-like leucin rich repeat domain-containing protein n=1 Tax=Peronospora effusa TaxID=542832 RepID=A0A3M6VIE9_9STRA|nr:hypothetical protein DD238_003422 [Peronospora effusa]RQM15396.1 hypothetical protein DD237_004118 [Peronospora effusa]